MDKMKVIIFIEWVYPSYEKNFLFLYRELKKYFERCTRGNIFS